MKLHEWGTRGVGTISRVGHPPGTGRAENVQGFSGLPPELVRPVPAGRCVTTGVSGVVGIGSGFASAISSGVQLLFFCCGDILIAGEITDLELCVVFFVLFFLIGVSARLR